MATAAPATPVPADHIQETIAHVNREAQNVQGSNKRKRFVLYGKAAIKLTKLGHYEYFDRRELPGPVERHIKALFP